MRYYICSSFKHSKMLPSFALSELRRTLNFVFKFKILTKFTEVRYGNLPIDCYCSNRYRCVVV